MEVSEGIGELIMKTANADDLRAYAVEEGMITILQDGIEKMLNGITTLEEVLRATRE
ncbi:hypothetical protein KKA69_00375 [Patescibacteria group bacterium]|nr:hypothetical protein [Patescibacteria group bacterium]